MASAGKMINPNGDFSEGVKKIYEITTPGGNYTINGKINGATLGSNFVTFILPGSVNYISEISIVAPTGGSLTRVELFNGSLGQNQYMSGSIYLQALPSGVLRLENLPEFAQGSFTIAIKDNASTYMIGQIKFGWNNNYFTSKY